MAFVATIQTDSSRMRNPIALGPIKMQAMTWTALSTDTSGTVTVPGFVEVTHIVIDGLLQTSAATFATNVATLAFTAPGGTTVAGDLIAYGI